MSLLSVAGREVRLALVRPSSFTPLGSYRLSFPWRLERHLTSQRHPKALDGKAYKLEGPVKRRI